MSDRSLRRLLERHYSALRRAVLTRHALRAAAACAVAIALAVILGALLSSGPGGAWLRLVLVAACGAGALAWAVRGTRAGIPRFDAWLEAIERSFPDVRSWLRNALDVETTMAPGTSAELAAALHAETKRRLERVPLGSLVPAIGPKPPLFVLLGALVVLVGGGLFAPSAVTRSWLTLWNPSAAAPPVRLVVEPGSVRVSPGVTLSVRARVWGSARPPRLMREPGAVVDATEEGVMGGEHRWRFDLPAITRPEAYRVRVASVTSPRYAITLDGTPAPLSFEVEYRAPAYARLPLQRGADTRGDLTALRGSRAVVEVTFDRDLETLAASLPGGATARFDAVTPRRWRGEIPIEREGTWALTPRASGGAGSYRYRITPLPDAPPVLAVRAPDGDQDLPTGQQIALEVLGQDDLGLSELTLQYRKQPTEAWRTLSLASFGAHPREAHVLTHWDASPLGLIPGESATFRLVLFDDNAIGGRGQAVSPTFELRFPSLAELYQQVDETHAQVENSLEKAADSARELQKTLDRLQREQAQRAAQQSAPSPQRSEEMKSAIERQQALSHQLDQSATDLRQSLEQAAERQAFDQELMRKLKELAELMRQIQSPELKQALERMQKALENVQPRALEQNLPQLRDQNKAMLENLERSLQLLKSLREEERLAALAERASELERKQGELNKEHEAAAKQAEKDAAKSSDDPKSDSKSPADSSGHGDRSQPSPPSPKDAARAAEQQRAADATEKLAAEAKDMAQSMEDPAEQKALEQAAQELEQNAAPEQRDAAQSSQSGQPMKASQSGQSAKSSLSKAAASLQQMSAQRTQQRDGANLEAVRRAAQDLVAIQRANDQNQRASGSGDQRSDAQTDLAEGVARVADSLASLAGKTPFMSTKIGSSLGKAMQSLQSSGKDFSAGNRMGGESAAGEAGGALNEAVLGLREAESSMCPNPGSGSNPRGGPSISQQMGDAGERQAQINRDTKRITQQLSDQMESTAGNREELQRVAEEQARVREQIAQIEQQDQNQQKLLGSLDQTKREMKEVEDALRGGTAGSDLEEKQQRILSRMLDAARSVHRQDFDPQRESRPGEDLARRSPSDVPADLMRESDRLRLDLLKAEADRYPAQYRTYIESYLRSLNGARR